MGVVVRCDQEELRASLGGSLFLPPDEGAPEQGDLIATPTSPGRTPDSYPRKVRQRGANVPRSAGQQCPDLRLCTPSRTLLGDFASRGSGFGFR